MNIRTPVLKAAYYSCVHSLISLKCPPHVVQCTSKYFCDHRCFEKYIIIIRYLRYLKYKTIAIFHLNDCRTIINVIDKQTFVRKYTMTQYYRRKIN